MLVANRPHIDGQEAMYIRVNQIKDSIHIAVSALLHSCTHIGEFQMRETNAEERFLPNH
jgi:hypothetical protein